MDRSDHETLTENGRSTRSDRLVAGVRHGRQPRGERLEARVQRDMAQVLIDLLGPLAGDRIAVILGRGFQDCNESEYEDAVARGGLIKALTNKDKQPSASSLPLSGGYE